MTVSYRTLEIDWLGYATIRLESDDTVVYLDPGRYGVLDGTWEYDGDEEAPAHPANPALRPEDSDVVCISHVHHYDPDGIERVAAPDAEIIVFEGISVRDSSRDLIRPTELSGSVRSVSHEDDLLADDVPIWTVPAYNRPDGPRVGADGTPYHPEGFGCGFLVSIDGIRVFWPGDSDVLDGHAALDVDVLCPPIGGSFTMDAAEAAELALAMEPDLVVPVHYNTFQGIEANSRTFVHEVASNGVPVALDTARFERD